MCFPGWAPKLRIGSVTLAAGFHRSCVSNIHGYLHAPVRAPVLLCSACSNDVFRPQHEDGRHDPADENEQTNPEDPTDPGPMPLFATLAFQPRVPIRGVSGY